MSKLSRRHRAPSSHGDTRPLAGMRQLTLQAAGVDMGAHEIVACVPDGEDHQLVRTLGTYPAALQTLADWLVDHGIQTVAMASTGVYWMPRFEELAARGRPCGLSSAASIQRVPGRKSDVLDCQWLPTLHRYGLLPAACRPAAALVALRTLWRHRAQLLEHRAPPVLHMPQALWQMNLQLSQALSDLTGLTGQRIIRAIVAGARDPQPLAVLRHDRCTKEADEIALALTGTWRAEPLCVLKQALALFDVSTAQLRECDAQSERAFAGIKPRVAPVPAVPGPGEAATPPRRQPHSPSQNTPAVHTRAHLLRTTGGDRVAVHGLSDALAQTMLAEIGTAMQKGPDDKPCCSWLGLAPKHAISGGKGRKSRTMKHRHRAPQAFRMAAQSVSRSPGAFGAFYRRMQGRLGPAQALVATAHKSARTVYPMRKNRGQYPDSGAAEYPHRCREREMPYVQMKAAKLGYTLSPA